MKIKLEPVGVFKAKGIEALGELRIISTWEGFKKLQCDKGYIIVHGTKGCRPNCLDTAWDSYDTEYDVIMASPEIAYMIK